LLALELVLQLATASQAPQIYQIDLACLRDSQIDFQQSSEDRAFSTSSNSPITGFWSEDAYLKECLNPNSCLVCLVSDRQVLGFGCLWSILEEAHIIMLAVSPEYRRRGLGRCLIWGMLRWASQKGLEWATLEVRASNQVAIALYQSFGFTEIGRRADYYASPSEAAVIMWRKGLHKPDFQQALSDWQTQIQINLTKQSYILKFTD
jgi:[ribosomal protein S18]-alanine N-acetyltransferase